MLRDAVDLPRAPERVRPKRRVRALWLMVAAIATGALACAFGGRAPLLAEGVALLPGESRVTIVHAGRSREALVYRPSAAARAGARAGAPLPVVLAFHGGGGNGEGLARSIGLSALAEREGFLAVYPDGTGPLSGRLLTWNAGACCGYAQENDIDDVGFVVALLEDLARRALIDRTRVYATGLSNGAMMAYRLAAEAPSRIAAIAPIAGAMLLDDPPESGLAVPVLHIHSVDDPRALYEGGLGPPFPLTNRRVDHRPVEAGLSYWRARNQSAAEPVEAPALRGAPGTPSAEHTATRIEWAREGDGSAEVVLWRLTGAGHVWPGGESQVRERLVGPTTRVIDADAEIWRFFRRHARPDAPALPAAPPSERPTGPTATPTPSESSRE